MYLSFNELSVNKDISTIDDKLDSKKCIDCFVDFLHSLKINNLLDGIVTVEHFISFQVFSKYGFKDWLEDPSVKNEHKQFLRSTWNKLSIYININDFDNEFSMFLNENSYKGIGILHAIESEGKVFSLLINSIFQTDFLSGTYRSIDFSTNGLREEKVFVENIHHETDISTIQRNEEIEKFEKISSGQDLWEEKEKLFPNLVFCKTVKEQLYLDPEKLHIISIMKRLLILQKYFEHCEDYNLKDIGFGASSESETVKSNSKLKEMRKFRKPNGEYEYFFDHIGFTGKFSGGRIHFFPDNKERLCFIGYIGRHLPTKKF